MSSLESYQNKKKWFYELAFDSPTLCFNAVDHGGSCSGPGFTSRIQAEGSDSSPLLFFF